MSNPDRPYRWIDRIEDLEDFLTKIKGHSQVAMDLEADSLYRYRERICLIQITGGERNGIIDTLALNDLAPLYRLLEDPSVEKIFHGADYDMRLLKALDGCCPKNLFDTMVGAQLLGVRQLGLSDLLGNRLGIQVEKEFQRADWGKRPISPEMIRYAVQDTCFLIDLKMDIERELVAKGRLEWAKEEFESLLKVKPICRGTPDASKVTGSKALDDRGRAVLQTLLEWRDNEARRLDVPPFKVMGTGTLLEVADMRPSVPDELGRIKGITAKVIRIRGKAILDAVKQGIDADPIPYKKKKKGHNKKKRPGSNKRLLSLKAVRDRYADKLDMDPGVVCSNAVLKSLAVTMPDGIEAHVRESLKSWQAEVLGEDLLDVLQSN